MWHQGDPIPTAYEPCKNEREEREYQDALSDPNRCYGTGIKDDPLVVWLKRPEDIITNRDQLWAHNNFAKAMAKLLGLTHTWIVKEAHDMEYARDNDGRKIPIAPQRYLLRDADMHITLRLGTNLYECRLSAHAYVQLDSMGNPEKYMTDLLRRFKRGDGGDSQIEFWAWVNHHRRYLPRTPVCLGPNWEIHANVGPYLDTYRPNSRLTCDTYTPRSETTSPRGEYVEDEAAYQRGKVIEGAVTREIERLVRKCNSAYVVYKELHMELAVLEHPPVERLRELHAMREHVATMKREIYREAKGILA